MPVQTNPNSSAPTTATRRPPSTTCPHDRDWYTEVATNRIFRRPCALCDGSGPAVPDEWVPERLARAG